MSELSDKVREDYGMGFRSRLEAAEMADYIEKLEARESAHDEIWAGTIYSIDLAWDRQTALKENKT